MPATDPRADRPTSSALEEAGEKFFGSARAGALAIQRCDRCAHAQFALSGIVAGVEFCRACGASRPPWTASEGIGVLITYTVVVGPPAVAGDARVRTVTGMVQLDEGPWIVGRIDCPANLLATGLRLQAMFPDAGEQQEPIPVFTYQPG
jgi:uncharacterized OB-fold protein